MGRQSSKRVIPSQRPRPASLAAKGSLVIARPVRRLVVAIRWPCAAIHLLRTLTTSSWRRRSLRTCVCAAGVGVGIRSPVKMSVTMQFLGNTDCHTSDVGHWFAMTKTDFVYSLKSRPVGRLFDIYRFNLRISSPTKGIVRNSPARREQIWGVYFFCSSSSLRLVEMMLRRPETRRVFKRV